MGASQNIPSSRLGVFATRDTTLGTATSSGFQPNVCVIGTTFGALTQVADQLVQRNNTPNLADLLPYNTVTRIMSVSDTLGGVANYVKDVDYELDDSTDPDSILWLNTKIANPSGLAGVAQSVTPTSPNTGLVAGTYYYVITAIRQIATSPSADGETLQSNEVTVAVGTGNPVTNAVRLTWTSVKNAEGYRIYRSSSQGVYTDRLIATVMGGASNTFLDDGYSAGTGTPALTNTATNRPADGASYYVSFEAVLFNHLVPTTFYSLNEVIAKNGLGSNVTMAATLILGGTGVGQGASKVTIVTIAQELLANYLSALTAIASKDVNYIVVLTDDDAVQLAVANHVVERSSPVSGKPRIGVFGSKKGTVIGDKDTVDTTVWKARRLELDDDDGNPQGRRVIYIPNNSINVDVQQADGKSLSVLLDGFFAAAAAAGRYASLPDVATSATYKQVQGISSLGQTFEDDERDFLQQNGLQVLWEDSGIVKIYQDRTIDLITVEDQERAIVTADDEIFRRLIEQFKSFVGRKITEKFLLALKDKTDKTLGVALKDEILKSYDKNSIAPQQDSTEPRRVWVAFKYGPMYSANQIIFRRGFNL